jgi:hypothetical protein
MADQMMRLAGLNVWDRKAASNLAAAVTPLPPVDAPEAPLHPIVRHPQPECLIVPRRHLGSLLVGYRTDVARGCRKCCGAV